MGRPSKLTPELQERICERIRDGEFPERAAVAEHIDESTYYRWMAKGLEQDEGPYREFRESVTRADAESEAKRLKEVTDATDEDGNKINAKWVLARRHRERWGDKVDVRVMDGAVSNVLAALREGLDQATFAKVLGVLDSEGGEG